MQRKIFDIVMILLTVALVACTQSTKDVSTVDQISKEKKQDPLDEKYNPYLLLMSEDQRARFFKLESDHYRESFLRAEGLEQQKYLNDHLKKGMPLKKVQELLGGAHTKQVDMFVEGKETTWIYSDFNGYRKIKYATIFLNDQLVRWKVWLE